MTVSAEVVENRRRWIERLESGQDLQCRGVLNEMADPEHTGGFCCLGIACDVVAPDAWIDSTHLGAPVRAMPRRDSALAASSWLDSADGIRVSTVMPDFVAEAMGMPYANAGASQSQQTLASMNDEGKPFSEIAALLRVWFGPDLDKELT